MTNWSIVCSWCRQFRIEQVSSEFSNAQIPSSLLRECCLVGRYNLVFHMIYTQNNVINFLIKSYVANSVFNFFCSFFVISPEINNVKIVQLSTRQSNIFVCVCVCLRARVIFSSRSNFEMLKQEKKNRFFCSRIANASWVCHTIYSAFVRCLVGAIG